MKETIENLDFNTMTEDDAKELLSSLLILEDDNYLEESVIQIIDKIDLSYMTDNKFSALYDIIFNNDKIKVIAVKLLEEYNNIDEEDREDGEYEEDEV